MNITNYGIYILYTLIYLALAILLKYVLNFIAARHYDADTLIREGNLALGLRRAGAQFGLAIGMIGVLSGGIYTHLLTDVLLTLGYGLLAMVFMCFSLLVTDRMVLPAVDNTAEIKAGNMALGIVEFGALVMTGILAFASLRGQEGGVGSSIIYFLGGQFMLILLVLAYERWFARSLRPVARVAEGQVAAGIYLAGKIIAYGLILQSAIIGDVLPESFLGGLFEFLITALSGMILLYLFEYLIDRFIVTTSTVREILEQNQIVESLQLSGAKIGMALILGMAIL